MKGREVTVSSLCSQFMFKPFVKDFHVNYRDCLRLKETESRSIPFPATKPLFTLTSQTNKTFLVSGSKDTIKKKKIATGMLFPLYKPEELLESNRADSRGDSH